MRKNYEDMQCVFPVLGCKFADVLCLTTAQKLSNVDSNNNDLKHKLATFTHMGEGIGYIIKLFKQSTPFAYKTNSSLNVT